MTNVDLSIEAPLQIVPRIYPSLATCKRIYQGCLLVADTLMLVLAFTLAYWLRFTVGIAVSADVPPVWQIYATVIAFVTPAWLALFTLLKLYDFDYLLGGTTEYTRIINGCTSGVIFLILANFLFEDFRIARGWLVMSWLLAIVLVCGARLLLRRMAYTMRRRGYFISPVVIVGTNNEAVSLAAQLQESIYSGVSVMGFIGEYGYKPNQPTLTKLAGLPILGTLNNLPDVIKHNQIEQVIIATTALTREQRLETALQLFEMPNVDMTMSSGLYEIFTTGMRVTTKNSVPLLTANRLRLDPVELTLKSLLDYTMIFLAAPALLTLFLVIGVMVKLDSPGPIFYRRRVLGVGGKEFDAFKFRTMVVNGDEMLAQYPEKVAELRATHKLREDPRITRIGHLLRRTSLDELPQLINVLLGQMSLVGPRMIHPDEGTMYGPYKSNLLTVKPGLTGLWQVSGRSDISYEERVRIDMHYIRNYNIWMDVQILFQTIPAVLGKRGAY
jgi:exopolysaccharide biosynthesis polyprenyl glycosylphosphotransferase